VRRFLSPLLLAALLLAPGVARAECRAAYTLDSLGSDIQKLQGALPTADKATLGQVSKRVEDNLVCLGRAAPPLVFASAYRLIGAAKLIAEDKPDVAAAWFRTALEIDPNHTWDANDVPADHPLRAAYEAQADAATSPVKQLEGMTIVRPAGSSFLLDGRPLQEPAAREERPHILQQVAEDNSVRASWRIEGTAFPEQVLRKTAAAPTAKPDKKKPDASRGQVVTEASEEGVARVIVQRVRPKEKTPLMLAGAAGMAAAGGVYGLAWRSRGTFEAANTSDQLLEARDTTNLLVMVSGGVFAAGLGVGYWGAILDAPAASAPLPTLLSAP